MFSPCHPSITVLQYSETQLYGHLIYYYRQFTLSMSKMPSIFCKFNLLITHTPLTWTFSKCMTPSVSIFGDLVTYPSKKILVVTWPHVHPPTRTTGIQCGSMVTCNLILHIHVVVNWQLSKQGIHWPVSHDHTVGSVVDPSRLHVF